MSELLEAWRSTGRMVEACGRRVFVVEAGPTDASRPPLVVLHGFPTSSHDFEQVLPTLAEHRRVVLLDFPGFGLSDKPPPSSGSVPTLDSYSYSLLEQAEVAVTVWRACGIERAHLLAHDYGTSVATELLARRQRGLLPLSPCTVTLCNGSMHLELAQLRVTQMLLRSRVTGPWVARLSGERFFHARMRSIFGDPDAVGTERLHAMWAALRHDDGHLRLPAISRYLDERMRFWPRWIGALRSLDRPTHVLWGRRDPVAVPAIATALHDEIEGSTLTWLESLGHYPMLEDPAAWAAAVLDFVTAHEEISV